MLHPLRTNPDEPRTAEPARRPRPLLRTTLGVVLRRNRLEQGRTLADVAGAAKVSMQYLSELERGRKEASSEVLAALCEALELDLPDVLAEVGRRLAAPAEQSLVRLADLAPGPAAPPSLPAHGPSARAAHNGLTCLLAA